MGMILTIIIQIFGLAGRLHIELKFMMCVGQPKESKVKKVKTVQLDNLKHNEKNSMQCIAGMGMYVGLYQIVPFG